jgi:sugar phosphate isomerase/epimerase
VLDIELACITRDREPESYERAFEVGAELGAKHVISSAWTKETNDRAFLVERFAELCDRAAPYGLTVNLEFPCFSRLKDLGQAADIVRAADRRNGGVLIDSLYFHFTHATLAELRALPREWINFLHIADARRAVPRSDDGMREIAREERLYLGEGGVDFPTLLSNVPKVPLSLELPNAQRVRELGYEGHARLCLQTARNYIANHLPEDIPSPATGTHG